MWGRRRIRYPASEKLEIIGIVAQPHLPAKLTLDKLGIAHRTFNRWYDRFLEGGPEAQEDRPSAPSRVWNSISSAVALKRRGIELRFAYASPDARPTNRDHHLIDLIRRGRAAWKKVITEQRSSNPVERSHLVRLARLRFLAPDITLAIIEGRQPIGLTARTLVRWGELPMDWQEQRKLFGFV